MDWPITEAEERAAGRCPAAVIDCPRNKQGTQTGPGERHRCASMDPAACLVGGMHRCSHGLGWSVAKSEPRET